MDFLPDYAPEYKFDTIVLYLKKYSDKREFEELVEMIYYKVFRYYSDAGCFEASQAERELVQSVVNEPRREMIVDHVLQRLPRKRPENFKIIVRAAIFVAANRWICNDRCLLFNLEELLSRFD